MRVVFEPKIESITLGATGQLQVRWRAFPGVTVLLENPEPERNLSARGRDGTRVISCDVEKSPAVALYERTREIVDGCGDHLDAHLLCRLPIESYHVTLAGAFSLAELGFLPPRSAELARRYLKGLPDSLTRRPPFRTLDPGLALGPIAPWSIRLEFDRLRLLGDGRALVAALKPCADSVSDYERVAAARSELYAAWGEEFGRWKAGDWQPHFTLGYLPTAVQPSSIAAPLGTLSAEIESELRGVAIEFSDANLYAFSGMTRFYRV